MKKPKVVVVGSCNMDIYAMTEHLPEMGETVIGERYYMTVGGKGANQAVAACRLGAEVKMVGKIGSDMFGKQILETLNSYQVDCQHVRTDQETGSGMALVIVDKKPQNVIVVTPGANMRIDQEDIDSAAEDIRSASIVMAQMEIPLEAIERAVDIAYQAKTPFILNPAPARPLRKSMLQKLSCLTPNQTEAKILTGIAADTLEGAQAAGKKLLEMGVPQVIITLGELGAMLIEPGKVAHIPGYPIDDAVDPSGAGDAFMGGLAVALAEGKPLQEAIRYANLIGGLSIRKAGAMPAMPNLDDVAVFIKQHGGI